MNDEQRAIQEYSAALAAKYIGDWEDSLRRNEAADRLRPGDPATLWNLAIAATALRDWGKARSAWEALGIEALADDGEVRTQETWACVRLQTADTAEVVWGVRIDPARMRIENVPLPQSQRRYRDIVLNDGAPEGERNADGISYPVFDELGLWQPSAYSTFEVVLTMPNPSDLQTLERLCEESDIGLENWGTLRTLCDACSRGTPGEHLCAADLGVEQRFGFGAKAEVSLLALLAEWSRVTPGAVVSSLTLVLSNPLRIGSDGR